LKDKRLQRKTFLARFRGDEQYVPIRMGGGEVQEGTKISYSEKKFGAVKTASKTKTRTKPLVSIT
jgi:hypothetical protein